MAVEGSAAVAVQVSRGAAEAGNQGRSRPLSGSVPGRCLLQALCCSLAFCSVGLAFRDGVRTGSGTAWAPIPTIARGGLFNSGFRGIALRNAGGGGVSPASSHASVRLAQRVVAPRMVFGQENGFEEAEEVAERFFRKFSRQAQEADEDAVNVPGDSAKSTGSNAAERVTFELDLKRPLGLVLREISGYGVYVEGVTDGGSAKAAGVQRGDRVAATSATMSNKMWEKTSMEGVMAAVNSAAALRGEVRIRFERDPVLASIVCTGDENKDGAERARVGLARALVSVEKARLRVQETAREEFEVVLQLPGKPDPLAPYPPRTKWTRRVPHSVLIGHAVCPRSSAPSAPREPRPRRPRRRVPGRARQRRGRSARPNETCPLSTEGGTRRVRLVRDGGVGGPRGPPARAGLPRGVS
jgi:hypothetical protein